MTRILLVIALSFCCLTPAKAQTGSLDSSEVLRQLLSMPAPTPQAAAEIGEQATKRRPPEFFAKENPPADDASIEDLVVYWNRWADNSHDREPTDSVKQRLLEACIADPELLPQLLPLLSKTEATASKIKELYDKALVNQDTDENWREKVRNWLLFNSKYFLGDLLARASKVKDDDKYGSVDNQSVLTALAELDWQTAEPLLNGLLANGQPRTKAFALTLVYRHAIDEKDAAAEDRYRNDLKAIAADRNALGWARNRVIEALSLTEWSGRDEWYLSLFQDETLINPHDGSYGFSPLTTLFVKEPAKWIPVMARLVESKDQTTRSAAASCLIVFQNQDARKDALEPLLPWLTNPAWAKDRRNHRLRLIQSMENIDLPESVPGLIWVVEHDDYAFNRSYAAQSLAKYRDPRAVPALKKTLATEKDEENRRRIIQGLLASGGGSETEQVDALEAFAAKLTEPGGPEDIWRYRGSKDVPLPILVSIGSYLSRQENIPASLVRAVIARAGVLQKTNPVVAQSLLAVAHQWRGRQIDLDLIDRIAAGTADAPTIAKALERRAQLRESVGTELQTLNTAGLAQGIAVALLDSGSLAQSVLNSGDQAAQIALLASARLTQMALPVETVGSLLTSKNQLLASAAERYLLVEDSSAARERLWAHHPGEAFITGWRDNIELMGGSDAMGKIEDELRAELFKDNAPLEIFGLIANYQNYAHVLRVYRNRAVYTFYENPTRYRERVIANDDLSTFKNFLTANNLEDLGPQLPGCHHNCWPSEFLSLTKEKGRRVFSQIIWQKVLVNFELLGRGDNAKTHYKLEKEIKGLEVLHDGDDLAVKDVWQAGDDIRVFVERAERPDESEEGEKLLNSSDEDDESTRAERKRREIALKQARFSWRRLSQNKIGAVSTQPEGYWTIDLSRFPADDDDSSSGFNERKVQPISADTIVFSRNFEGLWRQTAGHKAIRISEGGAYANPIVTADGKWVVVAKTDSDWGQANYIVRFNLQTGREYRVALPAADQFAPIAYLASHDRVLLRRARDEDKTPDNTDGPKLPEYYLLDATTGQSQLASGVFTPLSDLGKRFLQPTGKPNKFWAAIPDREQNQTQVGRYNLKDFSFQTLLVVPHINFDSMSMWVDEAGAKLYVVYEGQLLRLPLQIRQ